MPGMFVDADELRVELSAGIHHAVPDERPISLGMYPMKNSPKSATRMAFGSCWIVRLADQGKPSDVRAAEGLDVGLGVAEGHARPVLRSAGV